MQRVPAPAELIQAAERGEEALVRTLLLAGADPDAGVGPPVDSARRRRTALMAACEGGHPGCVKALLEAKASLGFLGVDARDALAWALEGARPKQEPSSPKLAQDAPQALACAELLLQAGAMKNINKEVGRGVDKATPLARATTWLDLGCMRLLLAHGADPCQESMVHVRWLTNAASHIGRQYNTLLGSAVSRSALEACEILLEAGADPTAKPKWHPSAQLIAERCSGVNDETRDFLKRARALHATRLEAQALGAEAAPAKASGARARM